MFRTIAFHERFGKLRYIEDVEKINKNRRAKFICDCGTSHICQIHNVVVSKYPNCGCEKVIACAALGRSSKKHGLTYSPEWTAWCAMLARCSNPNVKHYDRYGGRGITVCDRWKESFENFYADMGPRPSPKHSLERKNNDGNYEPDNCKWATRREQDNNKSTSRFLEYQGVSKTVTEWSRHLNITKACLEARIHKGWSAERALKTPVRFKRPNGPISRPSKSKG